MRLSALVLAAVVLSGCGGGDDEPEAQTPSVPSCAGITVGAAVDPAMFAADGAGCAEESGSTYLLTTAKCPDGSTFSTYDLPSGDQAFAYAGKWHSTKGEAALYRKAFDTCK